MEASTGGELATAAFETTRGGYERLVAWADRHTSPESRAWAVEGSGSYRSGACAYLSAAGEQVIEFSHPRTAAINEPKALIISAPVDLRDQLRGLTTAAQVAKCAAFRLPAAPLDKLGATKQAMRSLTRRIKTPTAETAYLQTSIRGLAEAVAHHLVDQPSVAPPTTAQVYIAPHTQPAAATKQHSPASPASPHSKRPPAKTPATASTATATARSTASSNTPKSTLDRHKSHVFAQPPLVLPILSPFPHPIPPDDPTIPTCHYHFSLDPPPPPYQVPSPPRSLPRETLDLPPTRLVSALHSRARRHGHPPRGRHLPASPQATQTPPNGQPGDDTTPTKAPAPSAPKRPKQAGRASRRVGHVSWWTVRWQLSPRRAGRAAPGRCEVPPDPHESPGQRLSTPKLTPRVDQSDPRGPTPTLGATTERRPGHLSCPYRPPPDPPHAAVSNCRYPNCAPHYLSLGPKRVGSSPVFRHFRPIGPAKGPNRTREPRLSDPACGPSSLCWMTTTRPAATPLHAGSHQKGKERNRDGQPNRNNSPTGHQPPAARTTPAGEAFDGYTNRETARSTRANRVEQNHDLATGPRRIVPPTHPPQRQRHPSDGMARTRHLQLDQRSVPRSMTTHPTRTNPTETMEASVT